MNLCRVCGEPGERHHIVYKNQGGIDIPYNYIYLCNLHHRGEEGPHKDRDLDIKLKKEMQDKLFKILIKDYYTFEEFSALLKINPMQGKIISREIRKYNLGYKKNDIVKRLMGNTIYY